MIKRYSKPSADILKIKASFFKDNESFLKENLRLAKVYSEQPHRTKCKICEATLKYLFFTKQSIDYFRCSNCGHINGGYEDTAAYTQKVYINNLIMRNFINPRIKQNISNALTLFTSPRQIFYKNV